MNIHTTQRRRRRCGGRLGQNRRRWPVERMILSTVAGRKAGNVGGGNFLTVTIQYNTTFQIIISMLYC